MSCAMLYDLFYCSCVLCVFGCVVWFNCVVLYGVRCCAMGLCVVAAVSNVCVTCDSLFDVVCDVLLCVFARVV